MGDKRGISTIIATVLIVLITVAAVTILWQGVSPLINKEIQKNFDSRIEIVTSEGYTFYDPTNHLLTLQLESKGEDIPEGVQVIITLDNGQQLVSTQNSPNKNNRERLTFDLTGYTYGLSRPPNYRYPISIDIAPIFVVDGKTSLGSKISLKKVPSRSEDSNFYPSTKLYPEVDSTDSGIGEEYTSRICKDTDGGGEIPNQILIAGIVTTKDGEFADYCFYDIDNDETYIVEYFCNLDGTNSDDRGFCPYGKVCDNGVCIPTP